MINYIYAFVYRIASEKITCFGAFKFLLYIKKATLSGLRSEKLKAAYIYCANLLVTICIEDKQAFISTRHQNNIIKVGEVTPGS